MNGQKIDALPLIRQIRDNHYRHLRGKTHEEKIAFYREQAQKMKDKTPDLLTDKVQDTVRPVAQG